MAYAQCDLVHRISLRLIAMLLSGMLLAGCSSLGDVGSSLSTGFGLWGSKEGQVKPAPLPVITPEVAAKVQWRSTAGPAGDYIFTPAEADGSLFVASADGAISRLEMGTGKVLWKITSDQKLSGGVGVGNGLIFVATRKGEVLAYGLDGEPRWRSKVSSEVLSAPQAAEGVVVVRVADGRIFGLDARDGQKKWVYQRELPTLSIRNHAGVLVSRGAVFAGYAGGRLVALALSSGALGWEVSVAQPRGASELERIVDITSVPVLDGKQICAVAYQGKVVCVDVMSGNPYWSRDLSSLSGLAVDQTYLYVSDAKGAVHALDRFSGASIWRQDKLANRRLSSPVVRGERVFVADLEGYVHVLAKEDGRFLARVATDGSAVGASPLAVGSDVIVQTRNGGVFSLTLE